MQYLNGATRGGRRETAAQVALKGRLGVVDRRVIAAGRGGLMIGGLSVRMDDQCQNIVLLVECVNIIMRSKMIRIELWGTTHIFS